MNGPAASRLGVALLGIALLGPALIGGGAAASEPLPGETEILAQLAPRQQTVLSSEIAGRIDRLPLKEGMAFKAGQLLASFDCAVEKARVRRAKAQATAARKKLSVAERLLEFNSSTALETEVAAAELAKAQAEVHAEAAIVSKCRLEAPFAGKVAEVSVFRHQFVKAGQPLMRVIDDSALEVEFLAPSSWLSRLRPDQVFDIEVVETGTKHSVRVARLGADIDPVSHSIKVVGEIAERPRGLMAGMTGRIRIAPAADRR